MVVGSHATRVRVSYGISINFSDSLPLSATYHTRRSGEMHWLGFDATRPSRLASYADVLYNSRGPMVVNKTLVSGDHRRAPGCAKYTTSLRSKYGLGGPFSLFFFCPFPLPIHEGLRSRSSWYVVSCRRETSWQTRFSLSRLRASGAAVPLRPTC